MRKKIDLDVTLTGSECGCGHAANIEPGAHPAAGRDCCGNGAGVEGAAHRHEEGCCGHAHARPATTRDRNGVPDKTEGAGR